MKIWANGADSQSKTLVNCATKVKADYLVCVSFLSMQLMNIVVRLLNKGIISVVTFVTFTRYGRSYGL